MNLTLHIVRKDLVRMRGWIACWVVLLVLPIVVGVLFIRSERLGGSNWNLADQLAILTGVELLFAYLLTILVLQEDSVAGTRQFWPTRPIARARLLVAKAASVIAIVGVVPVLVMLPWWLWCGFGIGQIVAVATETAAVLFLAVLPAAAVAVMTDSFARALLWTVAAVAILLFAAFAFTLGTAATISSDFARQLFVTRCVVASAVAAIGLVGFIALRFLGRLRGAGLAVAGALLAGAIGGATRWPAGWVRHAPGEHHATLGAAVKVAFHRAVAKPPQDRPRADPDAFVRQQRIRSQLVVSGVPEELVLLGLGANQRWSWPGGSAITRSDYLFSDLEMGAMMGLSFGQDDPERERRIAEHRALRTGRTFAPGESYAEPVTWLPLSIVARMRTDPPHYEARLWWQLVRPEIAVEVPLAPTPWVARHGHGLGVEFIRRDAETFTLSLMATRPVLLTPHLRLLMKPMRRYAVEEEQRWALLDRAKNRIVYTFGEGHADKPRTLVVYGVRLERRVHTAVGPSVFLQGKWVRTPDWSPGSSLATITAREMAVFSRDIEVPRYRVSD